MPRNAYGHELCCDDDKDGFRPIYHGDIRHIEAEWTIKILTGPKGCLFEFYKDGKPIGEIQGVSIRASVDQIEEFMISEIHFDRPVFLPCKKN